MEKSYILKLAKFTIAETKFKQKTHILHIRYKYINLPQKIKPKKSNKLSINIIMISFILYPVIIIIHITSHIAQEQNNKI